MKRRTTSRGKNRWADHYTRKARQEDYPARSVYKLQEIQKKHGLIKKGQRILDLGCAPGAWTKYAAELTGPGGRVVGIDLKPVTIALPPHARTVVGDMLEMNDDLRQAAAGPFHLVLSDMAPATTGFKGVDEARSFNLSMSALNVAESVLPGGGDFVCKIFQGPDSEAFLKRVRTIFSRCKVFRPQSTRKGSKEIFVIGLDKRSPGPLPDGGTAAGEAPATSRNEDQVD